jgi:hypothetical protein
LAVSRARDRTIAPTAFRAIKKEDPDGKLTREYDLSGFRYLFLAGERLDPETYHWAASPTARTSPSPPPSKTPPSSTPSAPSWPKATDQAPSPRPAGRLQVPDQRGVRPAVNAAWNSA